MDKLCYTCKKTKEYKEFNKNKSRKDGFNSICRECSNKLSREYYTNNQQHHVKQVKSNTGRYRKRNQSYVIEYLKTQKCVDCGIADIRVFQFDHIEDTKEQYVSNAVHSPWSLERLKKEMNKCVVRCANCHQIKTGGLANWYRHNLE